MPRLTVRLGDPDRDVPVTFDAGNVQQFVAIGDNGTITLTTTNCSIYAYLNGVEFAKVPRDSTRSYPVLKGQTFDVLVTGTTDANPTGNVHYSFGP
jgi:hypothetical protein